jgi:hypothetical protein
VDVKEEAMNIYLVDPSGLGEELVGKRISHYENFSRSSLKIYLESGEVVTVEDPLGIHVGYSGYFEHAPQKVSSRGYVMCATCGSTFALAYYAAHIATVTEQAVRDRVADESMLREIYRAALRRLGTDPDELDAAFREGLNTPISRVRGRDD